MDGPVPLPLPTLLSQTLVAFIIELDNEFEHLTPHRTSGAAAAPGSPRGPWLTSVAMWSTCLRFVGEDEIRVGALKEAARTRTNLPGLQRWGYLVVGSDPADPRAKPPAADLVIHATPAGRRARKTWQSLFGVVEERWRERFGADRVAWLRAALLAVADRLEADLPDCLPILGYGLWTRTGVTGVERHPAGAGLGAASSDTSSDTSSDVSSDTSYALSDMSLYALLSRVLLAFALAFEGRSEVSLAIGSDVLRNLGEEGVRVRDLPRLGGVSKEAIAMALGFLRSRDMAVVEADPDGGRWKLARLTPLGIHTRNAYLDRLAVVEEHWRERFGEVPVHALRQALEGLAGDPTAQAPALMRGLEPYPDGWRASVRRPEPYTLPHFPMMLHRGGYPDGS